MPWCLIGDFNAIRISEEKEASRPLNPRSMWELNSFVLDAGRSKFRWCNNQEGTGMVKQKLDRAMCNIGWSAIHPNCMITHLTRAESDHCPIVLRTETNMDSKGHRRFYYERGWMEAEGYHNCVDQTWMQHKSSNENLRKLGKKLTKWKRSTIGANKEKIQQLLAEIQYLDSLTSNQGRQEEEKELRTQLHTCWKIEENYWSQR
ncbi:hypothetical protein LINPERPRIM_LOCUS40960 [Linum perenne]